MSGSDGWGRFCRGSEAAAPINCRQNMISFLNAADLRGVKITCTNKVRGSRCVMIHMRTASYTVYCSLHLDLDVMLYWQTCFRMAI